MYSYFHIPVIVRHIIITKIFKPKSFIFLLQTKQKHGGQTLLFEVI